MLQKIMLEVEASKPLNSYGEGHVIVYNAQRNNYYVTTRENFLSPQNARRVKQNRYEFTPGFYGLSNKDQRRTGKIL